MAYKDRIMIAVSIIIAVPEKIDGFKLLVKHENGKINIYNREFQNRYRYDISERYYAVYNLTIRNNGSDPLYFKQNDLRMFDGNQTINATAPPPYGPSLEVLEDLEKENGFFRTLVLSTRDPDGFVKIVRGRMK